MSVCIVTNVRPEIHFIFDLSELLAQTSRTTIHWIQHTNQPVPPANIYAMLFSTAAPSFIC